MGAKTQTNAKDNEKRPVPKCEECDRTFMNISALKSHTMAKHPEKSKRMSSGNAETKEEKKTAFVPPTSRVSKRLQQKKSVDKEVLSSEPKSSKKTVFQCPKCLKEFAVFFPAHKHITNRHCEDKDGNPVAPDSPDIIKPLRKEICTLCDKLYHGTQPCGEVSNEGGSTYCCLACKHVFASVAAFNEHVSSSHDVVSNVILENMMDFLNWKSKVETTQRVKYLTLSNTTQKKYYQCNYVSPQNSADITHLCPSVMIIREFSKGIHVRYHKEHHEHFCEEYKDTTQKNDDIYNILKDIMKSITLRAAKLSKGELKPLYKSALDMQSYINSLSNGENIKRNTSNSVKSEIDSASEVENEKAEIDNQKVENEKVDKLLTDDQIVKALEGSRASARLKRKVTTPVPEVNKKSKKESIGLKENNSQVDACESPKPNAITQLTQSPSFNDSYKQFIDSTSPKVTTPEKEDKPVVVAKKVKKDIVKTKIGQFTPSPKKTIAEVQVDSRNIVKKKKKQGPILKDVKLEEVDYEVVEQENDCNILILKI